MTSFFKANTDSERVQIPIALIQAQDATFIEPLREYLVRHGCVAVVNDDITKSIMYHIVVGDSEYVKNIVASEKRRAEKVLVIIYEGGEADVSRYVAQKIHVAIIDPLPLTDERLRALLLLLFTGSARSLITRKGQNFRQTQSVIPPPSRREPFKTMPEDTSDQTRVTEIMKQVFKPTSIRHELLRGRTVFDKIKTVVMAVVLVCVVFTLSYIASLMMAIAGLYVTAKFIVSSNTQLAQKSLQLADSGIQTAHLFVRMSASTAKLLGFEPTIAHHERMILMYSNLLTAEKSALSIFISGKEFVAGAVSEKDGDQTTVGLADVLALRSNIVQLDQNLALVQTQLGSLLDSRRVPFSIPLIAKAATQSLHTIEDTRVKLGYVNRLFTLYPQLAGYRKKQTYLVLLQNSMELRPTGGFVGSLALVTFLDGKVTDVQVQDVYVADGQLKGHIDPPLPIREILGQEHWYLRDSNWDPNFLHAGAQAAWFYEKEMGVTVDGVVGISVPFITKLLDITGPLELSDYNDRISSTNFFAKSLLYTQTDFFPGSTQKKDFLGSLTSTLISHLTTNSSLSVGKLFSVISDALDAKDIQFYVQNSEIATVLQHWGWSGGMGNVTCAPTAKDMPCTTEYVGVIEANLGVNKVNYFISREAMSTISIVEDGTINHTLSYNIANNSSAQVLEGGGVYRSYIRIYYPQYTNFQMLEFDGIAIPQKDQKANVLQKAPYYEINSEGEHMVVGIYLVVDPMSLKRLTVKTTRLAALSFTKNASLDVVVGKQAGIDTIPWKTIVQYPAGWIVTSAGGTLAKEGELEYNTTLGKSERVSITFEKNL